MCVVCHNGFFNNKHTERLGKEAWVDQAIRWTLSIWYNGETNLFYSPGQPQSDRWLKVLQYYQLFWRVSRNIIQCHSFFMQKGVILYLVSISSMMSYRVEAIMSWWVEVISRDTTYQTGKKLKKIKKQHSLQFWTMKNHGAWQGIGLLLNLAQLP